MLPNGWFISMELGVIPFSIRFRSWFCVCCKYFRMYSLVISSMFFFSFFRYLLDKWLQTVHTQHTSQAIEKFHLRKTNGYTQQYLKKEKKNTLSTWNYRKARGAVFWFSFFLLTAHLVSIDWMLNKFARWYLAFFHNVRRIFDKLFMFHFVWYFFSSFIMWTRAQWQSSCE